MSIHPTTIVGSALNSSMLMADGEYSRKMEKYMQYPICYTWNWSKIQRISHQREGKSRATLVNGNDCFGEVEGCQNWRVVLGWE